MGLSPCQSWLSWGLWFLGQLARFYGYWTLSYLDHWYLEENRYLISKLNVHGFSLLALVYIREAVSKISSNLEHLGPFHNFWPPQTNKWAPAALLYSAPYPFHSTDWWIETYQVAPPRDMLTFEYQDAMSQPPPPTSLLSDFSPPDKN